MPQMQLETKLTVDADLIQSPNLAERFSERDLRTIGNTVWDGFQKDVGSRKSWSERSEAAMDLAMQATKAKSFPWANCSNVAFPLITIAALQFHSIAYPAIISGKDVVKARVIGSDPQGVLAERADRISKHMSWQVLEQDTGWEEGMDRGFLSQPIVGTAWKKTYYDASRGHNVSELVLAKDFVLDYYAKDVDSCRRKTHIIPFSRNEIHERIARGTFTDVTGQAWYREDATPLSLKDNTRSDERSGMHPPQDDFGTPFDVLEQHCWFDFDDDGYAEPYIITFESASKAILRIVARFDREGEVERSHDGEIIQIHSTEYFTKMPFIPSPDGSIMDIGFGLFLGPINESVNTAINQMFDAGTLSNTAGGFLGRGAKIRGGVYSFTPFSWQRVDSTGDDLRKNIFPMPTNQPSTVLFQLLQLLIEYTNRISGATDLMTGGNPGQNTTNQNGTAMIEQGQKVYSAIFKGIWRAMKAEFKKLAALNAKYLPLKSHWGADGVIMREDYSLSGTDVVPVADPTITSGPAKFQQAVALKQAAASTPGYNPVAVEKQFLKALGIEDIALVYPGPDPKNPPSPPVQIQVEQLKVQFGMQKLAFEKMKFVATLQEQIRMNNALIAQAQANAFKLMEQGKTEPGKQQVNAFNAAIEAMRMQNDHNAHVVTSLLKSMEISNDATESDAGPAESAARGPGGNTPGTNLQGVAVPPGYEGLAAAGGGNPAGADAGMGGG